MYELIAGDREWLAATQVAASVDLLRVDLKRLQIKNRIPTEPPSDKIKIGCDFKLLPSHYHLIDNENHLLVDVGARIAFRPIYEIDQQSSDKPSSPIVEITIVFQALYALPAPPMPVNIGKKGLSAFAKYNGAYNLWPYIRQEVQRLTSSMGILFTLPTLKIRRETLSKTKAEKK
ncbi:MAG: hypothetical protein P9M14_09940 [Candidatus Alcyoniella australis]|nr:hypothetical protein [Candidatus Alcyoniella australis]